MRKFLKNARGFSLAELLIVIALLGILASVVLLNLGSSDTKAKEAALKANAEAMRTAIDLFRSDHGFYPGSTRDQGNINRNRFEQKLLNYTRADGRPSATKSTEYKYGPYLKEFPVEPISGSTAVVFSAGTERPFWKVAEDVAAGNGTGGWYYEPETGNFCANLGSSYPSEYAGF